MRFTSLRRRPTRLIPVLWLSLVVVSAVATWAAQPDWWTWIAPEASLAREINTAMLLATAGLAGLQWWRRSEDRTVFGLLAVGFLGLAIDERVAIHERLRDRVLAPRDIRLPFIPWGEPGDIVLVVVAIVGLVMLRFVLRAIATDGRAVPWFMAGVALAVTAVALDTLPIETYQLRTEIYFQSGEEAIELAGAACFLSAMLTVAECRVRPRRRAEDPPVAASI